MAFDDVHLVFVAGFLDSSSVWDSVVSELGQSASAVTCVDLPGSTAAAAGERLTVDRLSADVIEVVKQRDEPVVLVGHSMGAQVAELVAAATADRTVGLALVTPVPLAGMPLPSEMVAAFKALANDFSAQCIARAELSVALGPDVIRDLAAQGITVPADIVEALVDCWTGGSPQGNGTTRYPGPALVIRGGADPFITEDIIGSSALRFPNSQLVTIDQSGHWPHIEQPPALAAVLTRFIAEHIASPPAPVAET